MGVRFGAEEFCKYDALMCAYDMLYHNQMRKPVYKKKKKKDLLESERKNT